MLPWEGGSSMRFEAAIGGWQDGYMSVNITLEKIRVTHSTYQALDECG